jgi:3-oxoacyl-[acyl-carrier protein] reductase
VRPRQAHIEPRALTVIHEFDLETDAQALLTSPDIEVAMEAAGLPGRSSDLVHRRGRLTAARRQRPALNRSGRRSGSRRRGKPPTCCQLPLNRDHRPCDVEPEEPWSLDVSDISVHRDAGGLGERGYVMTIDGKVVLVTGGGSGIGEAICVAFGEQGARVAVVDINGDAAELTAGLVTKAVAIEADVADSAAVERAVAQAEATLGPLDILVNNAGIAGRAELERITPRIEQQFAAATTGAVPPPLEATAQLTDEEWRRMLSVHLDGTFYCSRAALRSMAPRGTGVIVNIASICGMEGCVGAPHYSAAKAGILGFTRAMAKEVISQGVRVNAIAPGYIDTPMLSVGSDMMRQAVVMQTPLGRLGTPQEIAALAVYLAGDQAAFFVGATLSPNGGYVTV